ncbi:hypothetical protein N44_02471 [Microcystis aeruginosa NIES-44]|uniref:Uncharacterized protein n=1 Tax=Microcystis aeruginosa NIES-44 TaxID=449439 RepID=A0A0A1VX94_MICAE|nr:hypothetical protein N44_02471 [Microcystis aeruginosa NIES-44]
MKQEALNWGTAYTKSVFNSVINSQVMNCFSLLRCSLLPTPHTLHPTLLSLSNRI